MHSCPAAYKHWDKFREKRFFKLPKRILSLQRNPNEDLPAKHCLNDKKAQVLQFCDYAFTEQSLTASYWAVKTHTDMLYFIL